VFEILHETLESTGEMKLSFEIYFLDLPWEVIFGVISGKCLYL